MNATCYWFRPNLFARERTYRIEPNGLQWSEDGKTGRINYQDVREVRLYRKFMRRKAATYKKIMWDAHLYCRSDRLGLSPMHYAGFRTWEDRSAGYRPFADTLIGRLRALNPNAKVVAEHHWSMRLRRHIKRRASTMAGALLPPLLRLLRRCDLDRTAELGARLMRRTGPWTRAHRVARNNLEVAFPEKSSEQIVAIQRGIWDNFGRVLAEYAFLDRLWDYDPSDPRSSRLELDARSLEEIARLRDAEQDCADFRGAFGELGAARHCRSVRLAASRFWLELTGPLQLPRDARGRIEIQPSMQGITRIVEGWVREHPQQWLWMHRRWR
jgi:hypothetical protein